MRSSNRVLAVLSAATAIAAGAGGTASALAPSSDYRQPKIEWVSPVVNADAGTATATVHAKYHCSGGNVGTHLFIAVKQGPQVDLAHTSSQFAQTYYSTNWNTDGPGLSLICDGRSHNVSFVVKPDGHFWNAEHAPPLGSGPALVQFCMFDSTASEGSESGSASDYSMRKVVPNGG